MSETNANSPSAARLRRQRNLYTIVAIVSVIGSIAVAFPRRLERHRELKRLHEELIGLQAAINGSNQKIGVVQAEIGQAQREIGALLKP
jgi:hypothetical protein